MAVAFAARHPESVDRLVLFGTDASGPRAFTHTELNATLVRMHLDQIVESMIGFLRED